MNCLKNVFEKSLQKKKKNHCYWILFSSIYLIDNFPGVEIQFLINSAAIQTVDVQIIFLK